MLTNHCYQGECRALMRDLIANGARAMHEISSPPHASRRSCRSYCSRMSISSRTSSK
ncbi:hypothetical protein [Cupriavidus sp. RAF12]|uniref:hypothetical protein n=1 Tax=Cupriavidus sp. RAF12 TaxID=3233050 RepID=UPI003F903340